MDAQTFTVVALHLTQVVLTTPVYSAAFNESFAEGMNQIASAREINNDLLYGDPSKTLPGSANTIVEIDNLMFRSGMLRCSQFVFRRDIMHAITPCNRLC